MQIDIIGTGLTAESYDWQRPTYKWSVSSFHDVYGDSINLYFSMHWGQCLGIANEITLDTYPINEVIAQLGSKYFTSSIAYMIAYALYSGAKEINIFGVDMEHETEYAYQRPCLAYWLGYAKAMNVNIKISSLVDKVPYKYGYDTAEQKDFIEVLENRMLASLHKAEHTDDRERDQWLGSYHAHKKIIEMIRG